MTSKRKGKGSSIPGIEESFLGMSSKHQNQGAPSKPRRRKSRVVDSKTHSKDKSPSRVEKRTTSDTVLTHGRHHGSSSLKIEAFDFFQRMLNQCCGSQVFDVFNTASILKQFTPDIMKTVIYVIAESSKRVSPKVLAEAETQTQEKPASEEHHDVEISNITSMARQKLTPSKWQPIPELVQPRLTSPVSNSCSPVSAAVQALMSFARNENQVKIKGDETTTTVESSKPSGDSLKGLEKDQLESSANLNVFDKVSLTPVSSSPFLQPMSSSLMLHSEVKKSPSFSSTVASEADFESTNDSTHSTRVSFGGRTAPSFPWIKAPSKLEIMTKSERTKSADKNLPSISSILAPISSCFSDLSFQDRQVLSVSTSSNSSRSAAAVSKVAESQKSTLPPMGVIVSSLATNDNASPKLNPRSIPNNQLNPLVKTRRSPATSSSLLVSASVANAVGLDSSLKVSPKTVFRKILPKPSKRKRTEDIEEDQYLIIDTQGNTKASRSDASKDLNGDRTSNAGLLLQHSSTAQDTLIRSMSVITGSSGQRTLLSIDSSEEDGNDNVFKAPLPGVLNVINEMRQQGYVIKGFPSEKPAGVLPRSRKTTHSTSGKLEVASALLSMGSTDTEAKASGKNASAFIKEKTASDGKGGSSIQHSDILFTKTGTFQIEDIEIDPKKNKIEKDNYECGKCGRVFTSLIYLARHIKRVCPDMSLRKWKCDQCDKAFRHPFGLQQHIFTHTGERPFKCEQCSKAFYSANDLRRHERTHSGERPYSCSHCNKSFSTTISLKTHTYIHTGERPHKCPHCPKTFATSSKLSRHVVTHSDKRPFACNICVKTFNRSGDLRRHYNNVHNLEHGLLSCDQCNKLFATQKCLDNHRVSHNRNLKYHKSPDSFQPSDDVKLLKLVPGSYTLTTTMEE